MNAPLRARAPRCPLLALSALLGAGLVSADSLAGPTWDDDYTEDALETAVGAQAVSLTGSVLMINGRLTGLGFDGNADFVDMYLVDVSAPALLSLSTAGGDLGGEANFDTQLFLFRRVGNQSDPSALGLLANNDAAPGLVGSRVGNSASDGSFTLLAPGLYYIAISGLGTNPISETGELIFGGMSTPGAVVFGGERQLSGWAGQGLTGEYSIRLEAVNGVPAPGALALLGALVAAPRSRRRRTN